MAVKKLDDFGSIEVSGDDLLRFRHVRDPIRERSDEITRRVREKRAQGMSWRQARRQVHEEMDGK